MINVKILSMKKIIFIFAALVTGIQAFGQVTDIKYLATKTPQEIVALYPGSTINTNARWDYDVDVLIENSDFEIGYDRLIDGTYSINYFDFTSSLFCLFSDYIAGGIKIGDSLERLSSIDFAHTPYGRGKTENNLELVSPNLYQAYKTEGFYFYFELEDGVIAKILISTIADCNPNDINPYSPFGN
jgi:hypothetical protein